TGDGMPMYRTLPNKDKIVLRILDQILSSSVGHKWEKGLNNTVIEWLDSRELPLNGEHSIHYILKFAAEQMRQASHGYTQVTRSIQAFSRFMSQKSVQDASTEVRSKTAESAVTSILKPYLPQF